MHITAPGMTGRAPIICVCLGFPVARTLQYKHCAVLGRDGHHRHRRGSPPIGAITPPIPCLAEDAPTAAHCPTLFGLTADDQVDSSSHPAMPNQPLLLTGGPQSRALPRYRGYTHFRCPALGQPFFAADHTPRVHRLTISSGPRSCNTADIALVTGSHRW